MIEMINKPVNLYLGRSPLPVYINVSQFDTMWAFQFSIIYAGQPWTIPSGAHVILNGRKPDGNVFAFSGTVADNVATVNADVQMTAVAGLVECELSILASGKVVGTANFTLAVEAAPKSPSDISSESTLPAYAELLEVAAGLPDNIPQYIYDWLDEHPEATTTVEDGAITPIKLNGAFLDALTIQKTASGSVASFADGSVLPVKALTAQIEAQQSGEGDPSPSNIRPITGLSEMTVTRTGKNLWSFGDFTGYASYRVDTTNWSSNSVTFSGVTTSTGATVIVTYTPNLSVVRRELPITALPITVDFGGSSYITFAVTGLADGESLTNVQLEFGGTATDYEPYAGETYTVNWQTEAGSVYGGTLDATTGLLTLTHGYAATNSDGDMVDFLGNTRTWGWSNAGEGYAYITLPYTCRAKASTAGEFTALCNRYKEINNTVPGTGVDDVFTLRVSDNYFRITFRQTSIPNWGTGSTVAENVAIVKDYFASGNSLQLVWKIIDSAEPITYQLTPAEVSTLLGQNNMWSNTGDIAVTYRADPSLVIATLEARIAATQNIIAGVETSMNATQNYSIGDLLIVGDALYKATAAIANGANITVGTNVAATTVAEQLLLLANK